MNNIIKNYFRHFGIMAVILTLLSFTTDTGHTEYIPHVSIYPASFSLDSNSHTLTIEVSITADITLLNKDVYVEMMNDNLSEISVTDIDLEHQRLQIYLSPNISYNQRIIEILGRATGSGTVTIIQDGRTQPSSSVTQPPEEKLSIGGNWKLVRTYTSNAGDRYEDITFYNGLGYPEQIINIGASSTNRRNVVTPVVYDAHMRGDAKVYLPYESTANNTAVRESSPLSSQSAFYTTLYGPDNASYAYKENTYEPSPINRITAQWESGSAHRDADKKTIIEYGTNTAGEILMLEANAQTNSLTVSGRYSAGTLHKTTTTDADGAILTVYTDLSGKTVLQRQTITANSATSANSAYSPDSVIHNHDTYYVYNVYGELSWVITPEGTTMLSEGTSYAPESYLATKYSYLYRYDGLGNIIEKRQPGRESEYFVYDKGKRQVLYQDGNMRPNGQWVYSVWDNLNREAEKSLVSTSLSREQLQQAYYSTLYNNTYVECPVPDSEFSHIAELSTKRYYGYNYGSPNSITRTIAVSPDVYFRVNTEPIFEWGAQGYDQEQIYITAQDLVRDEYYICSDPQNPHVKFYYIPADYMDIVEYIIGNDPFAAYSVVNSYPGTGTPKENIILEPSQPAESNPMLGLNYKPNSICSTSDIDTVNNCGMLQYERHLLLEPSGSSEPQYRETAHYYNSMSQLIQSVTRYPGSDSLYRTSYSYTFTGNPASTVEEYKGILKRTDYTYDHRCRLIAETTTISSNSGNESATTYPPASITYSYDALGKLISKTYGNGVTETVGYNIQGWQTGMAVKGNNDNNIYSQQLKYYNPVKGTAPLYTGNISEWSTTMADHQTNTYGFGYDKFGRLSSTDYYAGTASSPSPAFTERNISYDKNGNIQTLQRYAQSAASPADSYTYSYEGNALASISGTDNNASISGVQYSYDANGNMIHDGLKNLELSYNLLNLPSVVNQSSTEIASYGWFADGSKYSVLDNSNNGYYYIGSLIYASNSGNLQIESTAFAGGRINLARNTGSTLTQDIQYHHTDHLGSVRAITNLSGETVEQNAYYPFGERHTFGNTYAQTTNRFKFNGKEDQTTGNLQYLDYGARMYDSKVARWFVQDPLSEKYYAHSQYSFSGNNPILNIDNDGKFWETFIDVASLIYDLGSALYKHIIGDHKQAQQNWKDVGIDAVSIIIPGLTAPIAKGVKEGASLAIEAAGAVVKATDDLTDAGKTIDEAECLLKQEALLENSSLGKQHGSLSSTKQAVKEARLKLNLSNEEFLEKGIGKFGSPMRGNSQKGYRLDPAHPNAKKGSGEEYPHVNYWDYTKGKRNSGGIYGVIPIKN